MLRPLPLFSSLPVPLTCVGLCAPVEEGPRQLGFGQGGQGWQTLGVEEKPGSHKPPSELVSQTVSKIRNSKVFYFKCPGTRCSKMRASRTAKPSCRLGPSRLPKRKSRARRARSLLPSTTMTWHPAGFRKTHGRTLRSRTKGSTDSQ